MQTPVRSRRELGQLLRVMRKQRHLTQAELATLVGVSRRWVVQVENAKTSADLGTLLRALGVLEAELCVRPRRESPAAKEIDKIIDASRRYKQ